MTAATQKETEQEVVEEDHAQNWHDWPLSRWRKHETEIETRLLAFKRSMARTSTAAMAVYALGLAT